MSSMGEIIGWVLLGLVALIFAYAMVRVTSFAYFRTKLEHLRASMKELRKGE